MVQLEIFTAATPQAARAAGRKLRDRGIQRAADHAGTAWSELAYRYLEKFLQDHPRNRSLTEQVRQYAYSRGLVPPPSERAWGGVIMRAVRRGIVIFCGYGKVSNSKAHCANAAVWRKS